VVFGVLPGAGPCSGRSSEGLGSGRAGEGVERSGTVAVFVTSRTGGGAEGVEGAVRPGGGVVFGVLPGAGPCSGRSSEGLGSGRAGEGVERSGTVAVFVTSRSGERAEGAELLRPPGLRRHLGRLRPGTLIALLRPLRRRGVRRERVRAGDGHGRGVGPAEGR